MLMRLLIMSENELCLRMQKTTAQTQSIKRAVKQTPTLTISIPDIDAIQDVDRHCQSREGAPACTSRANRENNHLSDSQTFHMLRASRVVKDADVIMMPSLYFSI